MKMNENLMAKRERIVMELLKGKQIATRLQTLLHEPAVQDSEPVSHEELAMQILGTFTTSLSELTSYSELQGSYHALASNGSTCSVESEKPAPVVKDGRGCYKRRKNSDSWTTITQTTDDGLSWRKYGQKKILNSHQPRCYFRCTNKAKGCRATKQVQKLEKDPFMYQTIYFNHHTCMGTQTDPHQLNVDLDPVDPNLISFQIQSDPIKEESHVSDPITDSTWEDILVGSDNHFGNHEYGSGFHTYGSSPSFIGHEMDDIIDTYYFPV